MPAAGTIFFVPTATHQLGARPTLNELNWAPGRHSTHSTGLPAGDPARHSTHPILPSRRAFNSLNWAPGRHSTHPVATKIGICAEAQLHFAPDWGERAHPVLNQDSAVLRSAARTTDLCTGMFLLMRETITLHC